MADEFTVTGVTQVIANLGRYQGAMFSELVAACEAVQEKVKQNAKDRVPYVTGNLQGSIMEGGIILEEDNITAIVGANANYAGFVEGVDKDWNPIKWKRNPPPKMTPYLGPALLENQSTFRKAIAAAVKRAEGVL